MISDRSRMQQGIVAVGAALAISSVASGQNLLLNGSLETPGPGFVIFEDWGFFNNVFADDNVEVLAQDGVRSAKMFGTFLPEGQSDNGIFQILPMAEGTQLELSAWTFVPSGDALQPLDPTGSPGGNAYGHLALLIIDFRDATGAEVGDAEIQVFESGVSPLDQWNQFSLMATAPAGTVEAQVTPLLIQWDLPTGAIFWDNISLTVVEDMGCNDADLAEPFGTLDFTDVVAFLTAFGTMDAAADLAAPFGTFDFTDVVAFLSAFGSGCP